MENWSDSSPSTTSSRRCAGTSSVPSMGRSTPSAGKVTIRTPAESTTAAAGARKRSIVSGMAGARAPGGPDRPRPDVRNMQRTSIISWALPPPFERKGRHASGITRACPAPAQRSCPGRGPEGPGGEERAGEPPLCSAGTAAPAWVRDSQPWGLGFDNGPLRCRRPVRTARDAPPPGMPAPGWSWWVGHAPR